jgi:hypothetical protein
VLRISLQCGEKCKDVTCALDSSFSGNVEAWYDDVGSMSQRRMIPLPSAGESPEASSLGFQGHHASA